MLLEGGKHPSLSRLCLLPPHSHEGVCMLRRALCDGHHLAPSTQPASSSVPKNSSKLHFKLSVQGWCPTPSSQCPASKPVLGAAWSDAVQTVPSNSSSQLIIFRLLLNSILAVLWNFAGLKLSHTQDHNTVKVMEFSSLDGEMWNEKHKQELVGRSQSAPSCSVLGPKVRGGC